ncbi:MAG TPA: hypothetical protein VHN99_02360, partial [Deinococcales bacterium]|nr:hypothetical protein [Deinococcales bacterium]
AGPGQPRTGPAPLRPAFPPGTLLGVPLPWSFRRVLAWAVGVQAVPVWLVAAACRVFLAPRPLPPELGWVWLALPVLAFPVLRRAARAGLGLRPAFLVASGVSLPFLLAAAAWAVGGWGWFVPALLLEGGLLFAWAQAVPRPAGTSGGPR